MKTFLIAIMILASTMVSFSQETTSNAKNDFFVVLYTIGENWDTTKQTHEQLYFKEHSTHLSELRKTKKISIGGRYSDTGMLLLKAKDKAEAQNLITNDIAIKNKIFKVEIFSFDPFYEGCVE